MPLHYDGEIQITKINMGPYNNNGYIVACAETKEAVIIDTPAEPEKLLSELGDVQVKAILITHGHQDHLLGFEAITGQVHALVGVGEPDAELLPSPPGIALADGAILKIGSKTIQVLSTPGSHRRVYLFSDWQAPVLWRHPVPRRPGQVSQPGGIQTGDRQHNP